MKQLGTSTAPSVPPAPPRARSAAGTRSRRTRAGYAVAAPLALLLVAGCGQSAGTGTASPTSPTLRIAAGTDALGRDAAPAVAGAPGVPWSGGWVLEGTLPTSPDRARVQLFPAGAADTAAVARLATALGLTAAPQRRIHGWVVAGPAGRLSVRDDGGNPWAFVRTDLADCPPFSVDVTSDDPWGGTVSCAVATGTSAAAASPVAPAAARALAAPVLVAAGFGPTEIARAQVPAGSSPTQVTLAPLVGGLATVGIETSVLADADGVSAAGGRLGLPAPGDEYPLRSARAAFDALASGPVPAIGIDCGKGGIEPAPAVSPRPTACPSPQPSRVTGADLGLMLAFDATGAGREVLVPAWLFTVAGTDVPMPMIAVDPSFLAEPAPTDGPTEPGASAGSGGGSDPGAGTAPGFDPGEPSTGGPGVVKPSGPLPVTPNAVSPNAEPPAS